MYSSIIRSVPIKNSVRNVFNKNARFISSSTILNGTFKVQDDKDFLEKVENSKEPVIVDFFAKYVNYFFSWNFLLNLIYYYYSWCGPCKVLEPRLQNVVAKRQGNITLAKVDIDDLGEVAARYEVEKDIVLIWNNNFIYFRLQLYQR